MSKLYKNEPIQRWLIIGFALVCTMSFASLDRVVSTKVNQ